MVIIIIIIIVISAIIINIIIMCFVFPTVKHAAGPHKAQVGSSGLFATSKAFSGRARGNRWHDQASQDFLSGLEQPPLPYLRSELLPKWKIAIALQKTQSPSRHFTNLVDSVAELEPLLPAWMHDSLGVVTFLP